MSWQQDIMDQLDEVGSVSVRFDVEQNLTTAEKNRAKNNIDFVDATAELISGNDYKIVITG